MKPEFTQICVYNNEKCERVLCAVVKHAARARGIVRIGDKCYWYWVRREAECPSTLLEYCSDNPQVLFNCIYICTCSNTFNSIYFFNLIQIDLFDQHANEHMLCALIKQTISQSECVYSNSYFIMWVFFCFSPLLGCWQMPDR